MPEPEKRNPIRETDDAARALARGLIDGARFGALGVRDPDTTAPMVTRIAVATTPAGAPLTLISDLSHHTKALKVDPVCSLLVGEPGDRGDPLTHPRLTLQCRASFVRHGEEDHAAIRAHYLQQHPKAGLYIDFADFSFAVLTVEDAHLNGGFGKAFRLTPQDLGL
ncbi:MAG: pyridoxamine 5-phosphate oxidase [Pseudomonadota bacterium]